MNSPSLSAAPDADSPHSFRAESEAATARKPLRLRSPSRTALHPRSGHVSASSPPSSPSLLQRSSSVAKRPVPPRTRQLMDGAPPPPQDEVPGAAVQLAVPPEEKLYNTEVRSCGHPQRLYVRVPVHISSDHTASVPDRGSSGATERDRHGRNAPVRLTALSYAEGTEATTPQRHPAGSSVHALASPIVPVSRTTVLAAPPAGGTANPVPSAPPAASVSSYAAESEWLPMGSAPLVAAVDEGCITASGASASPARAAAAEMSDTGGDGSETGQRSSPPLTGAQQPATSSITFIHATSSTRSPLHQRSVVRDTEVRNTAADVLADDATESASTSGTAASGAGKQLTEENDTVNTTYGGVCADADPDAIPLVQEGVSLAAMASWASREADAAAERELLVPFQHLATTLTEEAPISPTWSVSDKRWPTERSNVNLSRAGLPSMLTKHWAEANPAVPAPWQLAGSSAYTVQHSQPVSIGDPHPSSTQAAAEAEHQEQLYSPQPNGAKASEAPVPLTGSGKELRLMLPVEASRLPAASSLPCELTTAQEGDDDATATAAAVALQQQQQQRGKREATVVAGTHIAARDEAGGVVEECPGDGVGKTAAASIASPVEVAVGACAAVPPTSFSLPLTLSFRAEDVTPERVIIPAAVSHLPVELPESATEQAPSALAAPEPSALRDVSGGDDNDGGAAVAVDAVANATRTRQPIGESDVSDANSPYAIEREDEGVDAAAAGDLDSAPPNVLADAATDGDEVAKEGVQMEQRTVPPALPAATNDGGSTGRMFWSELSHMNSIKAETEPRQRSRANDDETAHGAAHVRDAPSLATTLSPLPSVVHTTEMWRWPPQPSPNHRSRHYHHQLGDSEQQHQQQQRHSWSAAALFQRRPVTRDLSVDVDVVDDEDNGVGEQDTAWSPRSLARCEDRDDGFVRKDASSSVAAPPLEPPSVDVVDALVLAHRRIIADAPLKELVELEREGRQLVVHAMLQDREAVLQQEAADFSIFSLLPPRPSTVAAAASTSRWKSSGTGSNIAASDGAAESLPSWVPPLPPPPTRREEVEQLLRTRGISSSFSLGIVSTALLADELLWREVVEDAEAGARVMLQRLCQCGADALNPHSVFMHEALARQGLMAAEMLERQRAQSLESSSVADVSELLEIGRELALCHIMEDDERRESIEKAEHLGRQRLRELHWRGLAARLRQRELLQATIDVGLRDAIDDAVFDEAQAREELRVEAIREMTKLLVSVSGTVVRNAATRHQRLREQRCTTPPCPHKTMQMSAASVAPSRFSADNVKSSSIAAADAEVAGPVESHARVGEGVDIGNDWGLAEEVLRDFGTGGDDFFLDAAVPPHVSALSAALSKHRSTTADATGVRATSVAVASEGAALGAENAPTFFEWDPTSNSASSPSTTSKARKRHPSSSAKQYTSTSSPSPHVTNMTGLTTATENTISAIAKTTSSEQSVSGGCGDGTPQVRQRVLVTNASGNTTSDSCRSPTTVLQTEEERQQLLQGHERVSTAEVSVLLHALRCAETAVRNKHQASRGTEVTAKEGSAAPAWLQDHDNSVAVPAENLDGDAAQSHSTPPLPPPYKQQDRVDGVDDVVRVANEPRTTLHSRHVSTTRTGLFINRHTIPCSLSSSPHRGYAALVHKYTLQREPPSSSTLLEAAAASVSSPSTSSLNSPRPYTDGDVYVYDPQRTRRSRPARKAPFETHVGCQAPWERSGEDIGDEEEASSAEAALDLRNIIRIDTPRSVSESTLHTPAREVFPTRRRRTFSGGAPSPAPAGETPPAASFSSRVAPQTRQPLVLEVITDRRSTRSSPTADVTVSPMSSGTRPSQSPTRAHLLQTYTAPTAAWAQYVQEQQLVRCVREKGAADVSGSECAFHPSPTTASGSRGVASRVNPDQSGCSRRRWRYAEDHTVRDANAPPAPLLITRLPLEYGPGVWTSSPRDAHSCVHVVATTASPRTRPAPTTLTGAFSRAARRGEVVRLPTTVAELLRVPQHTLLPRSAPVVSESLTRRLSCVFADDRHALHQRCTPCRYADVLCKKKEQTLRRSAEAPPPSTSASVQPPSSPSTAFISARCAAVCKIEIQRKLQRSLQPPSPSQACRAPLSSSARASRTGSSACAASSRRVSSTSSGSALITTSAAATRVEEEVLTEESAELEECYFDDDNAFVLRSVAVASCARRRRAVEQRRQQRYQPRCGAACASARSSRSPSAALPRQQRRHSATDAVNGARGGGGSGNRVPPPGYRALPAPSSSFNRSPCAWSLSSPASPATDAAPAVEASSWRNAPTSPAPANPWSPLSRDIPQWAERW